MTRMSAAAFRALQASKPREKRNKFGARKTEVEGIVYDSAGEARYVAELRILERQGLISDLETQVRFQFTINGVDCGSYIADAKFYDRDAERIRVTDFKGVKTPVFRLKAKLMLALHGVIVECVE